MAEADLRNSACGFVAHDGVRPVLTVDFNAQHGGGTMWARRGDWVLQVGQPVILDDQETLVCDGEVVELAPLNWHGKPMFEYVVVKITPNTFRERA